MLRTDVFGAFAQRFCDHRQLPDMISLVKMEIQQALSQRVLFVIEANRCSCLHAGTGIRLMRFATIGIRKPVAENEKGSLRYLKDGVSIGKTRQIIPYWTGYTPPLAQPFQSAARPHR